MPVVPFQSRVTTAMQEARALLHHADPNKARNAFSLLAELREAAHGLPDEDHKLCYSLDFLGLFRESAIALANLHWKHAKTPSADRPHYSIFLLDTIPAILKKAGINMETAFKPREIVQYNRDRWEALVSWLHHCRCIKSAT